LGIPSAVLGMVCRGSILPALLRCIVKIKKGKRKSFTELVNENLPPTSVICRMGFGDNVRELMNAAYKLGYHKGRVAAGREAREKRFKEIGAI
jgi:hypothetical protein